MIHYLLQVVGESPGISQISLAMLVGLQIQVAAMAVKVNKLWSHFGPKEKDNA